MRSRAMNEKTGKNFICIGMNNWENHRSIYVSSQFMRLLHEENGLVVDDCACSLFLFILQGLGEILRY